MPIQATPVPEVVETPEEALPSGSSLPMELLIENAVELLTAAAFIFLLIKGLRRTKTKPAGQQSSGAEFTGMAGVGKSTAGSIEISPEVLARAQVDDLVQNNPERVAQILSNWVVEDRSPIKSA